MVGRIEMIEDLLAWLDCVKMLRSEESAPAKWSEDQIHIIQSARELIQESIPNLPQTFKKCCKCKHIYPETTEWFGWSGQGRTGLHAICKYCKNAAARKFHQEEKIRKTNYGFFSRQDLEEVNRIRQQEGLPPLIVPPKRGPGRPRKRER
jgi:hypothetical protein